MSDNVISISNHEQLIARWKQGDARMAERLYDLHRDQAYRLALSLLDQRDDAEDTAQEALSYALLHAERYDPRRGQFSTWLYGIVVKMCRNRQRRKRRRERLMFWSWGRREEAPRPDTPEEALAQQELQGSLWAAVQSLPDLHKEALVLRMWGGHTYSEIAAIVECPQRTAQSRVRLALERLRTQLGDSHAWSEGEMTG